LSDPTKKAEQPARHNPYLDFSQRLGLLISKNPKLITITLSNIFTMRLIGNKTHGDLAEIAIAEFINQYMYDFRSLHVGKDLYRAKSREEDITVTNEITGAKFPVSLKAYGDGPLQLSTDKSSRMFAALEKHQAKLDDAAIIKSILTSPAFADFHETNVLPLIYDEKKKRCNMMVFDYRRATESVAKVIRRHEGYGRKHPVYCFLDTSGDYIFEVRYGDARANALQRGLWTHTKNGLKYFDSVTKGWISYSHNLTLVKLFSHALISTENGHKNALREITIDIDELKKGLRG
jgi:hypothetical protein